MRIITECFWCQSTELKLVARRIDDKPVSECQSCKLLLVTELPDDLSEFYTEEAYFKPDSDTDTGYHENYDLISPLYLYWQGAIINEAARLIAAKTLLEIGCATGNALEAIQSRDKSMTLTGIDLSPYAIEMTEAKGFGAKVSTINEFSKNGRVFDLLFSSETMEHVDDLKEFIDSVRVSMKNDGIYAFYIPAVVRQELIKRGKEYISLTTSLEHVSYFTLDFIRHAMGNVFGQVAAVQMSTDGEDYIIGYASKDAGHIKKLQKFLDSITSKVESIKDQDTLFNLAITSSKFALFDIANHYVSLLAKNASSKSLANLAGAILSSHIGELENAKKQFLVYQQTTKTTDPVVYKLMYANEKSLNELFSKKVLLLTEHTQDIEKSLYDVQHELSELKNSKLVGTTIRTRHAIGKVINPIRNQKKN